MATATYNKFYQFMEDMANQVHDLSADGLELYPSNATPDSDADEVKLDFAEITPAGGYTAPIALAGVTSTRTTTTYTLAATDPGVIITATGNVNTFQHIALFNTTPAATPTDPLIAWWDYGTTIDMTNGETFSFDWDTATTIFTMT